MSVFEKLKNALFEEEYVEVEEKPKKPVKKEKIKTVRKEKKKEERPIAKKVVLSPKKEEAFDDLHEEELLEEDFEIEPSRKQSEEEEKHDFKFMEDEDFKVDEMEEVKEEPRIVKVFENDEMSSIRQKDTAYQGRRHESPYGIEEKEQVSMPDYGGAYEKKEERTYFKPSPIISPIYGILDKNYKKEDVVSKREVHRSSYTRENVSVDDVRKKAYGSLSDDIAREIEEDGKEEVTSFEVQEDNLLVDLSKDQEKPQVKEVTMGDALEYFQDLGLEYNVDYVDATKEKPKTRREKEHYEEEKEVIEEKEVKKSEPEAKETSDPAADFDDDSSDNLFDLIDSMYQEND